MKSKKKSKKIYIILLVVCLLVMAGLVAGLFGYAHYMGTKTMGSRIKIFGEDVSGRSVEETAGMLADDFKKYRLLFRKTVKRIIRPHSVILVTASTKNS